MVTEWNPQFLIKQMMQEGAGRLHYIALYDPHRTNTVHEQ